MVHDLRKIGHRRVLKITASALPAGVSAQVPMAPDVALRVGGHQVVADQTLRRGGPRAGHSVPEAPMHFAGVACRALVLSALRLRVHKRCGNGVRPRRSAPGPKRLARRPKDGRWPAGRRAASPALARLA
ncbi:hypothetical protein D5045_26825 [Verminephrobacter eiseniae]|nr:hypothetical protein [Verminephrobacter eiseniae]